MAPAHVMGATSPQIVYAAGIKPLPLAVEAVLQSLFTNYERLNISQELGGGFTQSRVFVVQPGQADGRVVLPVVIKTGPVWLIEQEQTAYRRHIRDKLSGRIELVDAALVGDWGVLSYRLAGDGQFKHESLAQFFNQTDNQTLTDVVTGRLLKRLETLWRDARLTPAPYLGGTYDLLLPVHLIIQPQPLPPDTTAYRLTPHIFGDDYLETGAAVQLEGFEVIEVDAVAGHVTLDLPLSAGRPQRSHRLRLFPVADATAFTVGQILAPISGVVTRTRRERLQFEIDHAFEADSPLDLTGQTVTLPSGRKLFNPLVQLPHLLHDWPPVNIGTLHGDLNLQNILVDPVSGDVTLIDFSGAGEDHILRDLLHMETNVIITLLPIAALELGVSPEHICLRFFERLHRAATGETELFQPPRLWHPTLQKSFVFLAAIRQKARSYLAIPNNWAEYYRGLTLHLLGALKYKNLNDVPEAPLPIQFAFLGAATAVSLWQAAAGQSLPTPPRLVSLSTTLTHSLRDVPDVNTISITMPDGAKITNPIAVLSDLLPAWLGDDLSMLHGRLDLADLVDLTSSLTAANIDNLPDDDHLLHTLIRLEMGIVVGLLPPSLSKENLPLESIHFLFYERLHRAMQGTFQQFQPSPSLPATLINPFILLAAIRRQVARLFPNPNDQVHYYRGLTLQLLGALAQPDLAALPQLHLTKQLTFLAAALAADLWRNPTDRPRPLNPYQGLQAFAEADAPFFFGRETFVNQLVEVVEQQPLVAVTGPSGSGKSSVVFAGLVPRLQEIAPSIDKEPSEVPSNAWFVLSFRPGQNPIEALGRLLAERLGQNAEALTEALRHGRSKLSELLAQLLDLQPHANRLLLIIDQFEELYTLCPDAHVRRQFIDTLLSLTPPLTPIDNSQSSDLPPFSILLTLRADFLGKALAYRPLAEGLQPGIKLLGAMSPTELARAIEYPAEKMGISFEPGLVKTILDDVGDEPGRLPLLEFALTQLWQRQRDGQLTSTAYRDSDGVEGAVTYYADQIYAQLTVEQQSQARHIFTQLVQPGAGTEDTRRVAARVELDADWPLVQHLADARLVVTDQNTAGNEVVEVVHEALIQHWRRLRDWMETDRTFRAWQERLRAAILQWQGTEQDEGGLLRGAPLAEAEEWLAEREVDLSAVEHDFILRSITLREQQAAQIETDRQRQLRQAQERAEEQTLAANKLRRRAIWLGTALVMLLAAVIAALWFGYSAQQSAAEAQVQATSASEARGEAVANLATAQHNATLESIAKDRADANLATAEHNATLEAIARGKADANLATAQHNATLESIARGQADANFATAQYNATLEAIARGQADANLATAEYNALLEATARSDADANLATAQYNATQESLARATAVAETTRSAEAEATAQAESTKAIEAEETAIAEQATAEAERDRADEQTKISVSRQLAAQALSLLNDDPTLAFLLALEANRIDETTEARDVLLTALQTYPRLSNRLYGHAGPVESTVLSPDGQTMASAGADGTIILWQMQTDGPPQPIGQPLTGHNGTIKSLAFNSTSGDILASGSDDGEIIVWDVSNPQKPLKVGHAIQDGSVNTIAFNSDGETFASGSNQGKINLWTVQPNQPLQALGTFTDQIDSVESIAFKPNEKILVSAGQDKKLRLWDVHNPQQPQQMWQSDDDSGHKNWVWSVVFSPDGEMLASGDGNGSIILWDVADLQQPQPRIEFAQAHQDDVFSLAFSSDGETLASGSGDKTIILWDVESKQKILTLTGHTKRVSSLSFIPNTQTLISASWDKTVTLWDIQPDQLNQLLGQRLIGHDRQVNSVAFSPDGQTLASASNDGIVILWDTNDFYTPKVLVQLGTKFVGVMTSLAFSPDGKTLAAGKGDGSILLWDVQNPRQPQSLGQTFSEDFSYIESLSFNTNSLALASVSSEGTIALWDMQDRQYPQQLTQIFSGTSGYFNSIAFSPDGKTLAAGKSDGSILLWDVQNPRQPQLLGQPLSEHSNTVESLTFSPNPPTLASGSIDKSIILWDVKDRLHPQRLGQPLSDHNSSLQSVSFSPNGKTLASGGDDGLIVLWDTQDRSHPQFLGRPLEGHNTNVSSVAFNPNGNLLASGSLNTSTNLILWEVGVELWQLRACRKTGRNLTQVELDLYIPAQFQATDQDDSVCPEYLYPHSEGSTSPSVLQTQHQTPVLATSQSAPFVQTPIPADPTSTFLHSVPLACRSSYVWTAAFPYYETGDVQKDIAINLPSHNPPWKLWLLTSDTKLPPTVDQVPIHRIASNSHYGTSWSYSLTPDMVSKGKITIHTTPPNQLIILMLCSPHKSSTADGSDLLEYADRLNVTYLPLISKK
ncbi:MAG: PD40 domain-containing protein [Anaerolineae bacterium]|nr:PD40 domain-containing protein [Anaerolineae bacterium]